jgi:D-alanine-D-alanine ligase
MKPCRVLALMHPEFVPPESLDGVDAKQAFEYKTEFGVVSTLKAAGHDVRALGVQDELLPIRDAVAEWKPHVVFNLLEEFHGNVLYDHNVVSLLELLRVPYTGCNPRGLVISRSKALSKKLLVYHRIRVPQFHVFPLGRRVRRPRALRLPLFVKSLTEHASYGIAQASLVETDEALAERVAFVHRRVRTDAIAEEFIPGRELYVGVLGNDRLTALTTWELVFRNAPADTPLIATAKVKHDLEYQQRHGIDSCPAENLPPDIAATIGHTAKRIYRLLELSGYARIDFRLSPDGVLYFLDANPNPEIAEREEFASAALHAGISYPELLERILRIGLSAAPEAER